MIWPLTHSAEAVLNVDSQKLCFHWGLNKDFTAAVVEQLELLTYFNTTGNTMSSSDLNEGRHFFFTVLVLDNEYKAQMNDSQLLNERV